MLPAAHRMLRSEDFTTAVRSGARSGSRRLVIHYRAGGAGATAPALVGLAGADGATSRQLGADIDRLLARSRESGRRTRR